MKTILKGHLKIKSENFPLLADLYTATNGNKKNATTTNSHYQSQPNPTKAFQKSTPQSILKQIPDRSLPTHKKLPPDKQKAITEQAENDSPA
jgi:hypothetical protein